MAAKYGKDHIRFSSGRKFYANHGTIGLCGRGIVSQGADGGFGPWWPDKLSDEECVELADLMLHRWSVFRAKHSKG